MGALSLLVTGAAGFVGRATVAEARAQGHKVRALIRPGGTAPPLWQMDDGITVVAVDLAEPGRGLGAALDGVDAVIHLAGAMTGPEGAMLRDTVIATEALMRAIGSVGRSRGTPPRCVLASSLAVYASGKLAPGTVLTERFPLEDQGALRDGYTRAKLAQEQVARAAAEKYAIPLWVLRPGAVFGPGHVWNAHLGQRIGPLMLRIGGRGEIPVSFVDHTAAAFVAAAARTPERSTAVNVIDDDLPDRARYLAALRDHGGPRDIVPRHVLPLHWRVPDMLAGLLAPFARDLPGLLRRPVIRARVMPLRYDNRLLHDLLGWQPCHDFAAAMALSLMEPAP